MPTACSPQDCTSCTSMIGGRPGLYKYLLKIRAVIPLPPVSVRFRFLSSAFLFSSYTAPPLSTKDPVTSLPFPRSTFCAPSCFPPFQLSPASSVCPPPPLLVTFSLCSLIFPHYIPPCSRRFRQIHPEHFRPGGGLCPKRTADR